MIHPNTVILTPLGSHTFTGAYSASISMRAIRAAYRRAAENVERTDRSVAGAAPQAKVRVESARRRIEFLEELMRDYSAASDKRDVLAARLGRFSGRVEARRAVPIDTELQEMIRRAKTLRDNARHEALAILGLCANADLAIRAEVLEIARLHGVRFGS